MDPSNMQPYYNNPTSPRMGVRLGDSNAASSDNHKPKVTTEPSLVVTNNSVNNVNSRVVSVTIPDGADMMQCLFHYTHHYSVTVLSGWGWLSHAIPRDQVNAVPGPFSIESISGIVISPLSRFRSSLDVIFSTESGHQFSAQIVGATASSDVGIIVELQNLPVENNNNTHHLEVGPSTTLPSHVTIDVPAGNDIVQWLFHYNLRHSVSMFEGSGWLQDIIPQGQVNAIAGPFWILSMSDTVPSVSLLSPLDEGCCPFLDVTLLTTCGDELQLRIVGGRAAEAMTVAAIIDTEPHGSSNTSSLHSSQNNAQDDDNMVIEKSHNDEFDYAFWNSLDPICNLSPVHLV